MRPEDVLRLSPKILSQEQRESYFENGYLLVEKAIDDECLNILRNKTKEVIGHSRKVDKSDATWDLEPGHCPEQPRLRRLTSPNDYDPIYWSFASSSFVVDIVADLVGPNVKFHHSKLNFKWSGGGEEVKWHQDIGFWPHTNFSPCTVGLYLYDCDETRGPLGVISGSHKGPLYDQYNPEGRWMGCLSDKDIEKLDTTNEVYLTGPAGSLTIHNCRIVHGSKVNRSDRPRPLLLNAYAAADAMPYTYNPVAACSKYNQAIVRGTSARWARHDPGLCLLPPDWSGGYTSIFALQQEEDRGGKNNN